jgi:hypothetical protein
MLIIGARRDERGKYYFLLQNWWASKFFVQVSAEYLQACVPSIYGVNKVITRKQDLTCYIATYAERSLDEVGDQVFDENSFLA